MAEPLLRDPETGEPARSTGQPVPASVPASVFAAPAAGALALPPPAEAAGAPRIRRASARDPSREMLADLRKHVQGLADRVEKAGTAGSLSLKRELSQDAEYIRIRARSYHQRRPLEALGMVAMAAFVLGLAVGFWRR